MKKFLLAIAVVLGTLSSSAIGLEKAGIANHLGVDLNVSTNGIGFEVSTPITRFVQARLGLSVMPGFKFHTDVDVDVDGYGYWSNYVSDPTMEVEASFKRVQGSLIFNVYPFPVGSFYVAAGAYFGGKDLIKISGHSEDYAQNSGNLGVLIGDYRIPMDKDGNIKGGLKVNSFRPYLGIGWGRPVPNRRINFGVELGVQLPTASATTKCARLLKITTTISRKSWTTSPFGPCSNSPSQARFSNRNLSEFY